MSAAEADWLRWLELEARANSPAMVTPAGTVSRGQLADVVEVLVQQLGHFRQGSVIELRFRRGNPVALAATLATLQLGCIPFFRDQDGQSSSVGATPWTHGCVSTGADGADLGSTRLVESRSFDTELARFDDSALPGYILSTSGTSGSPRLVHNTGSGLRNVVSALVERYALDESSRSLQFAPLNYDAWLADSLPTLFAGGTLVYGPTGNWSGFRSIEQTMLEARVTHSVMPPSVWRRLSRVTELRVAVSAGESLDTELALKLGEHADMVVNAYGPSEAAICSTTHKVATSDDRIPLGDPLPGVVLTTVAIDGRLSLQIRGVGVAHGYFSPSDLNSDRSEQGSGWFGSDSDGRFFQTADLVEIEGAHVYFVGRSDRSFKRNGRFVNLDRIEHAVRSMPGVAECRAEEHPKGVRCYVAGSPPVWTDLRAQLSHLLDDWELPSEFVQVDGFERGPSDKVVTVDEHSNQDSLAKDELAALWEEWTGSCEPDTSFFASGGDSLGAMELLDCVASAMGAEVDVVDFVESPTLNSLRVLIRDQVGSD